MQLQSRNINYQGPGALGTYHVKRGLPHTQESSQPPARVSNAWSPAGGGEGGREEKPPRWGRSGPSRGCRHGRDRSSGAGAKECFLRSATAPSSAVCTPHTGSPETGRECRAGTRGVTTSPDGPARSRCWFTPPERPRPPGEVWAPGGDRKAVTAAPMGCGRCGAGGGVRLPTAAVWRGPRLAHRDLGQGRSPANPRTWE